MKNRSLVFLSCFLGLFAGQAKAFTLDDYLNIVLKNNGHFQSVEESRKTAETRYQQGDLELSPFLTASAFYQDDKSNQYGVSSLTSHQQIRQYSLGLSKKFSTGTQASVQGNIQAVNALGVASQTPFAAENHIGTLAFSLTQSLWKDFGGANTRLRWERESLQKDLEINSLELQKRNLLIEAESLFWDFLYIKNELQVREASLERARKIETWVRSRVANGIGDRADLLNAQGLVATRELQLISSRDEMRALEEKMRNQLGLQNQESLPVFAGNIEMERRLQDFLTGSGEKVTRIDAYLSAKEVDVKSVVALEAKEKVKPDLNLQATYKTNSYESTDSKAFERISNSEKPVFGIGVQFSWALDWDAKNAVRSTAQSEALAAKLKLEQRQKEASSSWLEIQRRHQELNKRIEAAKKLAEIQVAKSGAEREKLSKGRTVTSQVITAEQDAAEAQLNLAKLSAEQRKLESSVRLFVKF
jgi:outer membrane protein TolC